MISHMQVQDSLMKKYNSLLKKSTIREIALDSGIQQTRIFRLLNGSEMKLSEYLIIKERVVKLSLQNTDLVELAIEGDSLLSTYGVEEMSKKISRKLRIAKLVESNQTIKVAA